MNQPDLNLNLAEVEAFIVDVLDSEAAYQKQITELKEDIAALQAEIYRRWLRNPIPFKSNPYRYIGAELASSYLEA